MEIFSAIALAVSPHIASYITNWFKNLDSVVYSEQRVALIRLFLAVVAIIAGSLNAVINGEQIDAQGVETAINGIVYSFITYIGAHGLYFFQNKKEELDSTPM